MILKNSSLPIQYRVRVEYLLEKEIVKFHDKYWPLLICSILQDGAETGIPETGKTTEIKIDAEVPVHKNLIPETTFVFSGDVQNSN